ncbi:MAG: hypothetical protein GXY44_06910 [Phycisphaerales bacterium]|nr:hypothetical protein [Phycisphaerales bacterium]
MSAASHSEGRFLFVAPSLNTFPETLRAWLAESGASYDISPDLYDALALLVAGHKPELLLVDIDAVDWNEMEFFHQAGPVCRTMQIFVTGPSYQQAKLETACRQGARLLDARAIAEILQKPPPPARTIGHGGLLAGSLRPVQGEADSPANLHSPTPRIKPATPPIKSEPRAEPPVRLVMPSEQQENEPPIAFPWSPSPSRPKRTPPKAASAANPEAGPAASPAKPPPNDSSAPPPVELTSEEINALMGRTQSDADEPRKERRQC